MCRVPGPRSQVNIESQAPVNVESQAVEQINTEREEQQSASGIGMRRNRSHFIIFFATLYRVIFFTGTPLKSKSMENLG